MFYEQHVKKGKYHMNTKGRVSEHAEESYVHSPQKKHHTLESRDSNVAWAEF